MATLSPTTAPVVGWFCGGAAAAAARRQTYHGTLLALHANVEAVLALKSSLAHPGIVTPAFSQQVSRFAAVQTEA